MTHRSKKKRQEKRRAEVIKRKAQFAKDQAAKKKPKKTVRPTIQLKKQGETVTAAEADRRSKERRKTARRETVLPTIQLKKPIDIGGPKQEERGFIETFIKGPKGHEELNLKTGTLPFGLNIASTVASTVNIAKAAKLSADINKAAANAKNIAMAKKVLKGAFSKGALAAYGAWAGSVMIGLWATAEAPESIAFPEQKFLITDAVRTGDWSLVDEAEKAKYEILDLSTWEKIIRLSPASFILIFKKIQGALAGAKITSKIIEDKKKQQEEGTTETDYWDERREEQAEQDKAAVDYYNEQRKLQVEWEREAEKAGRNEDAAFWRKERAKQAKMEAEDRQAIADFWIAYRKEALKIANDNRPSNLNFGLL